MASLKPAQTMRNPGRAFTRTAKRKVKKAFITGVPDNKVRSFHMGTGKMEGAELQLDLLSSDNFLMRDNSLESARIMANKIFENKIGRENYVFKIRVYPHEVIREHAILSGAGADRLSAGMRHAFGRPKGRAAHLRPGQKIMSIWTKKTHEKLAREGMYRAAQKLCGSPKTVINTDKKK